MLGKIHTILAIVSLALGFLVLTRKKGGKQHRYLGYFYSIALLLVNLIALSVYRETGEPGPFHVFAIISLVTLCAGFFPAFLRKPRIGWMNLHGYFMSWSYVGLVAAGIAQLTSRFSDLSRLITVGLPSMIIILFGAFLIHTKVPHALAKVISPKKRPELPTVGADHTPSEKPSIRNQDDVGATNVRCKERTPSDMF